MLIYKPTYFIDLDGTLFDQRGFVRVSARNQIAILIMHNFANVVVSTGRSYNDYRVKQVRKLLKVEDFICSSGAEVYINNELVSFTTFKIDTINNLVNFAKKNKVSFVVYDTHGEHLFVKSSYSRVLAKLFVNKWMKSIALVNDFNIDMFDSITKISFVFKSPFSAKRTLKKLEQELGHDVYGSLSSQNYVIEITDINTNKAKAAIEYARIKGIDLTNSVHIGDSMSDACMKGVVGKLVAMSNSPKELKELAHEVAPRNKGGGIYKYLIQHKSKK